MGEYGDGVLEVRSGIGVVAGDSLSTSEEATTHRMNKRSRHVNDLGLLSFVLLRCRYVSIVVTDLSFSST